MKRKATRLLLLGGAFGPILFTLVILICSGLRVDYNHVHQFISELGATGTPCSPLMNYVGFLSTGILMLAFGVAMFSYSKKSISSRIGAGLLVIFGFGIFLSGLFSCDQGCPDLGSQESNIHQAIAPVAFMCAIFGIFLSGISFRRRPEWKKLWIYSVLSSVLSLVLMMALINSLDSRMFTGLWQRLMLLVIFVWTGVIGVYGFNLEKYKMTD